MEKRILELFQSEFALEVSTDLALEVFQYQKENNPVYGGFLDLLKEKKLKPGRIEDIPFLPIELFKTRIIKSQNWRQETVFESSGTSGQQPSRHYIKSLDWYERIHTACFQRIWGPPADYCHLALLPSYLERSRSSLVHMVNDYIEVSQYEFSGFFLKDSETLRQMLIRCKTESIPTILWGVSFALLDFIENGPIEFPDLILIETGGMKGKRKELIRRELHERLKSGFSVPNVGSEYGMTELLSQAYSKTDGKFRESPSLRIGIVDIYDPRSFLPAGVRGRIALVDLANLHTCSFVLSDDIGIQNTDGSFEVLGRMDNSELRGCNLLYN